jgi:hypothetical protein
VPVVPAGGAVEFAVDYAANTARVAFYTPAAVAAGFDGEEGAPHAKMELRFNTRIPDGVTLYPALHLFRKGLKMRLMV